MPIRSFVVLCLIAIPAATHAEDTPAPAGQELAASLKPLLLQHLPPPLTQTQENWGKQVEAVFGRGKRNHGTWRKVRISAINPANTLTLDIRNLQQPTPNISTFDLVTGVDAQLDFEQQIWDHGVRLY